jgi:hypothetical protein
MPDEGRCGGRLRPGRNFRRVAALVQQEIGPDGQRHCSSGGAARWSISVFCGPSRVDTEA